MNHFQRYFLDEFVEDFRDGRLNRRDFILRAIAVSGGLTAAAGLLRSLGLTDADAWPRTLAWFREYLPAAG